MRTLLALTVLAPLVFTAVYARDANDPLSAFRSHEGWTVAPSEGEISPAIVRAEVSETPAYLVTKAELADIVLDFEYRIAEDARALLVLHGRYELDLPRGKGGWQRAHVKFRAARIDDGRAQREQPFILEARLGDAVRLERVIPERLASAAAGRAERSRGPVMLVALKGAFALRGVSLRPADFEQVLVPRGAGEATNLDQLVDFVALGAETFESSGCSACHSIKKNDTAVTSGPNLFGLFKREPRSREVVENSAGQRFRVRADETYLRESVRDPGAQLAIAEQGGQAGNAYPALMPAFTADILSDVQLQAIGAFLATLNDPEDQGPAVLLAKHTGRTPVDPIQDRLQLLVDDEIRIQRGPMAGVSGRAIHVGQPSGVHYSFDPRILGFAKIWQGGFLDRSGELRDRGGKGLQTGHDSRVVSLGDLDYVLAPFDADGKLIDFSFKEAKFGDAETVRAALHSSEDHLARLARIDAKFLGYTRPSKNKLAPPRFRYRVGRNTIAMAATFADDGRVRFELEGPLQERQRFGFNNSVLREVSVTHGTVHEREWIVPAGTKRASLHARIALAQGVWRPEKSQFDYRRQRVETVSASAALPAGYSIESYLPPKDNYGRDQLFEALGLALAADGTIFVATRTAGIWRLSKNEWQLFAEGPFDSLGIVLEDKKGRSVVVGQKAELTRITDVDGDGVADEFATLFDAHSFHGNYHAYMHGPVRGADGAYYIAINLAHANDDSTYKAGGEFMGTTGGFSGWAFRVEPNGTFTPWAHGLRSPAGLAVGPDGRLFYTENQGEYVGTSRLFGLERDRFYGHPASLVDLPGLTPESPEIAWTNVAATRTRPIVLFPHNRVANSPGHPVWDTTRGKFGVFAGQMLIGDQTQSNLLRVTTERVDGIEQGSVMPFMQGLASGAMRPLFLEDGSLLLGQTGRGWHAKGGHVASLQRIWWDGRTVPAAIRTMRVTPSGFRLELTRPLAASVANEQLARASKLRSWVYRDAPDYGSDELDAREEPIVALVASTDRKKISISLASLEQTLVHPQQTARVYHAQLAADVLFETGAPEHLDAYYTLYAFPERAQHDHE